MTDDTRPSRTRTFQDPEKAREAQRRSAAVQAERRATQKATEDALRDLGEGVAGGGMAAASEDARSSARVVAQLRKQAEKGDVASAKLVLDWERRDPAQQLDRDAYRIAVLVAALSTTQRRALLDWLLAQDLPANGDNREGSNEVDRALPRIAEEQEAAARADGHPREPRDSDAARAAEPQSARDTPKPQP